MKTIRRKVIIITFMMIATLALSSCQGKEGVPSATEGQEVRETAALQNTAVDLSKYTAKTKQTNEYFSTTSTMCIYDDFTVSEKVVDFQNVWEEAKAILDEIEKSVSVSVETSDLAKFNALQYGESLKISKHTANIIKIAKEAYEKTGGLYDPTVCPLVDLWGFTPRFNDLEYVPTYNYDRDRSELGFYLPDKKYIDAFAQLVDLGGVELSGDEAGGYTLKKMIPAVTVDGVTYNAQLDFGGIAKGYAADLIQELLRSRGYEYGYFSCGSSSIALLKSASETSVKNKTYQYKLGIRKPRAGKTDGVTYMSVATKDSTLSSSGDYDHCYTLNDIVYCHIVDTRTGYPINTPADKTQKGIATVTVIGGNAAYCDALSTALCVMGPQKAIDYMNKNLKDYKVSIVLYDTDYDSYEVITNMAEDEFVIEDSTYVVVSHLDEQGNAVYDGKFIK